ncbi:MAG TPA: hypothetical protein VGK97_04850 [Spongiibacteraceae bacterium]|jgi:hypothetical protein
MRNTKIILLATVMSLIGGCASIMGALEPPTFKSKKDAYDGSFTAYEGPITTQICTSNSGYIAGNSGVGVNVNLGLALVQDKTGSTIYAVSVSYFDQSWLFINPKSSLDILADEQQIHLVTALGSINDRHVDGNGPVSVTESANYAVQRADIARLALAKRIQFKITGTNGYVERCVLPSQIPAISEFLNKTSSVN